MLTNRALFFTTIGGAFIALLISTGPVHAGPVADVLCYFERGLNPAGGSGWADPANALVEDLSGVSLGRWSDDGGQGTNNRPVGLMVGFSTSIANGAGNDLKIMGNALDTWWEPGYIEVAAETTPAQTGATTDGWQDETFYMIKPGNFSTVGDPRDGPLTISYAGGGYQDAKWQNTGDNLYGYADVNMGGDYVDIDDAIDAGGNYVSLDDIAYVRIRTVTDSDTGVLGYFSTEILYVEAVPEPVTMSILLLGLPLLTRRSLHR